MMFYSEMNGTAAFIAVRYIKHSTKLLLRCSWPLKARVNTKAVFWLGIMVLTQISRSRFEQSKISLLISHIYVLSCFVNILVILGYIWG